MAIRSEEEWGERAAAFLKHKIQEGEITYAELAKRLKKHGFKKETEATITNKLQRRHIFGDLVSGLSCRLGIGRRSIGGNLASGGGAASAEIRSGRAYFVLSAGCWRFCFF